MLASAEAERFFAPHQDLADVQERLLLETILAPNAGSEYGREHHFSAVTDADAFRRIVPLVDYERLRPAVDRIARGEQGVLTAEEALAFFKTSGSLASPKLVPVTASLVRDKARAFGIFWHLAYQAHPKLRNGKWIATFGDAGRRDRSACGLEILSEATFWNRRTERMQSLAGWPLPPDTRITRVAILRRGATRDGGCAAWHHVPESKHAADVVSDYRATSTAAHPGHRRRCVGLSR